jgi:hypothetical protein
MIIERTMNKSIFKNRPLYKSSASELVEAPASAQLFAETFPDLGKMLNIKMVKRGKDVRWMMPEWASYTLEQIPVFSSLGKAAVASGDPQSQAPIALPENLDKIVPDQMMRPPFLDFMGGMKFIPQSTRQLKDDKKYRKQEAKRKTKAITKDNRDTLTDAEVRAMLDRK